MKLTPLGDRVVLKQLVAEETTKSGIVIPGQAKEKPQQAEVIAVGPGGVIDGKEVTMQVKVGQKVIFSKFALPKVLKRIGLLQGEIVLTGEGLDELIEQYKNTSGIRDLEQAAEHLAANALYQIEVDHVKQVVFDAEMVKKLFA